MCDTDDYHKYIMVYIMDEKTNTEKCKRAVLKKSIS